MPISASFNHKAEKIASPLYTDFNESDAHGTRYFHDGCNLCGIRTASECYDAEDDYKRVWVSFFGII
jgi:hypothetical protein